jgi:hypothetical protein
MSKPNIKVFFKFIFPVEHKHINSPHKKNSTTIWLGISKPTSLGRKKLQVVAMLQ